MQPEQALRYILTYITMIDMPELLLSEHKQYFHIVIGDDLDKIELEKIKKKYNNLVSYVSGICKGAL